MAWTEEMVEGLRQMQTEGLTANEIAKRLGVSKNSIVGKVHRLCLKARPSPIKKKEDEAEIEAVETAEVNTETPAQVVEEVKVEETAEPVVEHKAEKKHKGSGHIKLVELDSHTCRWPLGDPRDEDFCFCGRKVRMGQTYCEEHANMAYVKATKK